MLRAAMALLGGALEPQRRLGVTLPRADAGCQQGAEFVLGIIAVGFQDLLCQFGGVFPWFRQAGDWVCKDHGHTSHRQHKHTAQ
jgi:hypothetical protein